MKKAKQPAVFLDRDGTIINERGYLADPKKIFFYKNSFRALKLFTEKGYRLIVVTNQSGVARGYFSLQQLKKIHRVFLAHLKKQGIKITGLYFCPHAPDAGCPCRKPKPLFAFQAARNHHLDLQRSFMVGDQDRDIQFGTNAGMTPILVLTGGGKKTHKKTVNSLPVVRKDLLSAARWIPEV